MSQVLFIAPTIRMLASIGAIHVQCAGKQEGALRSLIPHREKITPPLAKG
jgi:hypothetical protein